MVPSTEPPLFLCPVFSSQTAYSNHLSTKRRPAFAPARQDFPTSSTNPRFFCAPFHTSNFTHTYPSITFFTNNFAIKRQPALAPQDINYQTPHFYTDFHLLHLSPFQTTHPPNMAPAIFAPACGASLPLTLPPPPAYPAPTHHPPFTQP